MYGLSLNGKIITTSDHKFDVASPLFWVLLPDEYESTDNIVLKDTMIDAVKQAAKNILSKTDWYIVRSKETDSEIPSEILSYRANIRQQSNDIEAEINAMSEIELQNYSWRLV